MVLVGRQKRKQQRWLLGDKEVGETRGNTHLEKRIGKAEDAVVGVKGTTVQIHWWIGSYSSV